MVAVRAIPVTGAEDPLRAPLVVARHPPPVVCNPSMARSAVAAVPGVREPYAVGTAAPGATADFLIAAAHPDAIADGLVVARYPTTAVPVPFLPPFFLFPEPLSYGTACFSVSEWTRP